MNDDLFDDDREYDRMEEQEAAWRDDLITQGISEHSKGKVRDYLAINGDAVSERVDQCLAEAERLTELGLEASAVLRAVTAAELIIRYLVVRPLFEGAFLADVWAELLQEKIFGRQSRADRELFPAVLKALNVDLVNLGADAWRTFTTQIVSLRNRIAHEGAQANKQEAVEAIRFARNLMQHIVDPLATQFGLSWPKLPWHHLKQDVGGAQCSTSYDRKTPFRE